MVYGCFIKGSNPFFSARAKSPETSVFPGFSFVSKGLQAFQPLKYPFIKRYFSRKNGFIQKEICMKICTDFYIDRICRSVAVFSTYSAWHFSHASCMETGG